MTKQVVVIGGGAAGTTAANSLRRLGYKVTILEKNEQLGGRLKSIKLGEQSFEMGGSFVTSGLYENTIKLLRANDLSADLHQQKQKQKHKTLLVKNGTTYSGVSLLGNKVLPLGGKLVAIKQLLRVLIHWRKLSIKDPSGAVDFDTRSVSEELSSKSGKPLLDNIVQPLLDGYLYWTPEVTSLATLMVLIRASLRVGSSYGLMHGNQQLPKVLAKGCNVVSSAEVQRVEEDVNRTYKVTYKQNGKTEVIVVDGVVCATTASVASKIIKNLTTTQSKFLSSVSYSSTIVIARVFKQPLSIPNYQIVYPRTEHENIICINTRITESVKGYSQKVTVYSSGEKATQLLSLSDSEIEKALAIPDLATKKLALTGKQEDIYMQKWYEALPEFSVGYYKQLKSFVSEEDKNSKRLVFAGDYLGGPYIEGAVTTGIKAAEQLHNRLSYQ